MRSDSKSGSLFSSEFYIHGNKLGKYKGLLTLYGYLQLTEFRLYCQREVRVSLLAAPYTNVFLVNHSIQINGVVLKTPSDVCLLCGL